MKSIRIAKQNLVEIVTANMAKHLAEFEDAYTAYRAKCERALDTALFRVRETGAVDRNLLHNIPEPKSYAEDYRTVLLQLSLTEDDTIELDDGEFEQYVQDRWGWTSTKDYVYSSLTGRA